MHLKDFGLLNYPCGPILIGVLDFHPVEFRVWGSFSFLALIFVRRVIFFVSSHFQFLLASIWAFCPYTLGGPLEPPTSLQPPDHHHHDHLMAHYQSRPSTSTGTVVTVGNDILLAKFPSSPLLLGYFPAPTSHLWPIQPPRLIPLAEIFHLRLPPTSVVASIAAGDSYFPDGVHVPFQPIVGQTP